MRFIQSRKHAADRQPRHCSTAAFAVAALALPGAVPAQPAAPPPAAASQARGETTLPAVKVQARKENDYKADTLSSTKFSEPLLGTPQTIAVIKEELVRQQGATTLTEALKNTPGVGTFFLGENGSTSTGDAVYMRGFDASGSIFVDGIRDLGSISRDVFNIDRIEVEKGPAGADNGRGTPGGSVNLVSRHAELGNSGGASVTWGYLGQNRATLDLNRQLTDTIAARVDVVGQASMRPGRDKVQDNRWGVAPTVAFGLGTPTVVKVDLLHVEQDNVPDGGVPTIGLPGYTNPDAHLAAGARVAPRNFYGTDADFDDASVDMGTLQVEHRFDGGTVLRNTTRLGETVEDYMLTSFKAPAAPAATAGDPSTWTLARSNVNNKHQVNAIMASRTTVNGEARTGPLRHAWNAGLELVGEAQRTQGFLAAAATNTVGAWPAANLYDPASNVSGYQRTPDAEHSEGKTGTVAAYAFDTLHFGERFLLTGGLRLDHYRTHYDNEVLCGGTARNALACPAGVAAGTLVTAANLEAAGTLFGWKLGGVFKPVDDASLYADYAVSSQPPGGTSFSLSSAANSADNPNLDAQKARTAEVGVKWNFLDGELGLTAALYRTDISNDIESDGGTPPVYFQSGRKRVQGVEIAAVGNLSAAWAVNAGFTTMDSRIVSGARVGNDGSMALNYLPRIAFTSWTTYRLPFGWTLGGGASYNGRLQRGIDGAVGTPKYTSASWVANGMLDYPVDRHLDVRLNVYNLANKPSVAAINKSGYRYTPGTQRYATVSANWQF